METERLILRPWEDADAEECFRYASDPHVGPPAGWPPHTDIGQTRQIIRTILSQRETYAVVWKETGLPIGSVALHFHTDLAQGEDECELGYWLGAPYWGKGIMPEAAGEMLRHAFRDLGLKRVWCGYYEGNERSRKVQEKCGFRHLWVTERVEVPQMGEFRKGHVSCLTLGEWEKDHGSL